MDEYQHPLFFEANELTDREKEKIRRHFQRTRASGGGECGMIEKVGDKTYKVCFKEKQDQERVLKRKVHSVNLPCGELHLNVSETRSDPDNPEHADQSSTTNSQTAKAKSLEKVFSLDTFLLYYLRDNDKASKALQRELSSIGCTVELRVDAEEAVVRGDTEKGPDGGAAEQWELQVDRVFNGVTESYICHHVFEPKQVKMLLQDASFETDDIKVYTERGYAVVVGEIRAVKERIELLEKSLPTRKEVPVMDKVLNLVEEEFSREMRVKYPEVKISRGSSMIILEGPGKEVQSGAAKLNELINNIKEKRVQLPTDLITFITASGAVEKYWTRFKQSLKSPVSIEVGPDLVLSSLSSDSLNEAEAAVLRDLSVEIVKLQGATAVPPDLDRVKEALIKAKNRINGGELKVDVSLVPGPSRTEATKVRLVGYNENVNELKEVLHDYQINQITTQEVLNLPNPEMIESFDRILDLTGMKQTDLTLQASPFPNPCVLVSGPRCLVQKVQADLNATLSRLASQTLVLKGPGVQWYFQGEGKKTKEMVESSCQVVITEQKQADSQSAATASNLSSRSQHSSKQHRGTTGNTPQVTPANQTALEIKAGSLDDEQVKVLVAPMISTKLLSTKIGTYLHRRAGVTLQRNFDLVARKQTVSAGDVLQVDAPSSLACSKIFFIECAPWDGVGGRSQQALGSGLKKCLDLCVQQGHSSVALPIIGPGVLLKYPLKEAIQLLTDTIGQFGSRASCGSLSTIHVVIKPDYPDSEECYREVYKHLSLNMNQGGQAIFRSLTSDLDDITMTAGGGVKLQVVFGDITNETTDAVVKTTDCQTAKVNQGTILKTQSGVFPCKSILHVHGEKTAGAIEKQVCHIIQLCESSRYSSVAIPAVCARAGNLDPGLVAGAMLRGINTTVASSPLRCLATIRLVLTNMNVFLEFKKKAVQMFPSILTSTKVAPAPQRPPPPAVTTHPSILCSSYALQQSVFLIVGLRRQNVDDAIAKLKSMYRAQCSSQRFRKEELAGLSADDVEVLRKLVEAMGVHVEEERCGQGSWTVVSGLKDGVNTVMQMIDKSAKQSQDGYTVTRL